MNTAELLSFHQQIRQNTGTVEAHTFGDLTLLCHTPSLPPTEARELAAIALRPPPQTVIYKYGTRSLVGRYALPSGREVALKYYFSKNLLKKIRYGLGTSRCRQSWLSALILTHFEIPTPAPLAIYEQQKMAGLFNPQSFFATEIASGTPLSDLPLSRLESLATPLTKIFDRLKELRIAHGDLKASNIIVNDNDDPCLIDLDATRISVPEKQWPAARQRDREIFCNNWPPASPEHKLLQSCITP